jgi:hypothetical protein
MASTMNTKDFFGKGTPNQYEFTLNKYDQALRLKAEAKSSKPENVIKLDKWYQNDLPKKIKSRGKDAHLVHDELVQTIKWKLARGKFRPNLVNLVQMNTPRVAMQETKKAFRKLAKTGDIQAASQSLCTLKGVGPGMASAVLAAGRPDVAPFMADECIMSMPEYDGLDYTMKEYMRYVEYVKTCVERLNSQSPADPKYTPHIVELAVWTHYILYDLKPELLEDMPTSKVESAPAATAAAPTETEEVPSETATSNGAVIADEDTKSSMASSMDEDSNSEAKNHNINPVGFAELEAIAETPSAAVTTESEAPQEAPAAEKIELAEVTAAPSMVENGNNGTPKTNGNNSHSNGSSATPEKTSVAPIAKEISANGAAAVVAKDDNEKIEAKVSEQNGVKSSEKESTDLRSPSPSAKRSLDEAEQPVEKKLKTCEENAAEVGAASEAAAQAAPTSTPQVAV